jgi:hypothetical protein
MSFSFFMYAAFSGFVLPLVSCSRLSELSTVAPPAPLL